MCAAVGNMLTSIVSNSAENGCDLVATDTCKWENSRAIQAQAWPSGAGVMPPRQCGLSVGSAEQLLGTTVRKGGETVLLGRRSWLNTEQLLTLRAVEPSTVAALRRGASVALSAAAGTTASLLLGWWSDQQKRLVDLPSRPAVS